LHAQRDIAACAPDAGVALDEIADLFQIGAAGSITKVTRPGGFSSAP